MKGSLVKTGKEGVYTASWYMSDKSLEEERYAQYKDNSFVVELPSGASIYYVKDYPKFD